ncbi:unnamed protein product [Ixodes hexagonus]
MVCLTVRYLGVPLEHYRTNDQYWREETENLRVKAEKWRGNALLIFARATNCNTFLAAKLWYTLQVLHCSRINIQRIHRVFAVFVWSSTWERMGRTNLFRIRRVKDVGLGLTHLFIRQLVNRFMFLCDQRDPFLRTVIQLRLHNVLPEFVVASHDECFPGARGYLKEVIGAYRFLVARFSLEYLSEVSHRRLSNDLIDLLFPVPLYRSKYSAGPGMDVLKRVKKMIVPASVKTFFFKLHSETLPVKTWLIAKGVPTAWSEHCVLCKQPETIEHVFLDCWDAVFFWDVLQRTLKKDFPLSPHGIRYLCVESEDMNQTYDLILLLGLHSIWRCRMAVRHADINVRPVYKYFVEMMCFLKEVMKVQQPPPEWLPVLEKLATITDF